MNFRQQVIKLAHDVPELRRHIIPILRQAMEFDTDEALNKYLKEHPKADKSNHSVNTKDDEKGGKGENPGLKVKPKDEETISKALKSVLSQPAYKNNMPKGPKVYQQLMRETAKEFDVLSEGSRENGFENFTKAVARKWRGKTDDVPLDQLRREVGDMAKAAVTFEKTFDNPEQNAKHTKGVAQKIRMAQPSGGGLDWSTTASLGTMGGVVAMIAAANSVLFTNAPMSSDAKTFITWGVAALLLSPVIDIVKGLKLAKEDDGFHKWLNTQKGNLEKVKKDPDALAKALVDMYADMPTEYLFDMYELGEKAHAKGK